MTPDQIDLVQTSFSKVKPIADTAAEIFYGRLFEIAPAVRPFFPEDLSAQGKKLMAALGAVVAGLKAPDKVIPVLEELAVRHKDYGTEAVHYPVVGEALIWTLEKGLGPDFTPDVKDAWVGAYTLISSVMTNAAYGTESAA